MIPDLFEAKQRDVPLARGAVVLGGFARPLEGPVVAGNLSVRDMHRADTTRRVPLTHGDVVIWGGAARLRYHGVLPLKGGQHSLVGGHRINLTSRKAL